MICDRMICGNYDLSRPQEWDPKCLPFTMNRSLLGIYQAHKCQ